MFSGDFDACLTDYLWMRGYRDWREGRVPGGRKRVSYVLSGGESESTWSRLGTRRSDSDPKVGGTQDKLRP
jgi:hypothetical protein